MAPSDVSLAGKVITLPTNIVSPTDIARLTREIEAIDNFFREQSIRTGGEAVNMPVLSKLMDQLAADNQMNLLNENDRKNIFDLLQSLHNSAPVMHISFSVDPPGAYVQKIVDWLRNNIHEHTLVTVGLQPNIGAGCIVRTTNRLFDFSLREFFSSKRDFFIEKMHEAIVGGEQVATAPQQPAPAEIVQNNSNTTVPNTIEQKNANSQNTITDTPIQTPKPIAVVSAPDEEVVAG